MLKNNRNYFDWYVRNSMRKIDKQIANSYTPNDYKPTGNGLCHMPIQWRPIPGTLLISFKGTFNFGTNE